MKLALILMIKNEEKIIERCLKAVEGIVDAFCITDTGSTDSTRDIVREFLKTHEGCLVECEWKDFGTCRSISFDGAQTYIRDVLKWDLADTYGLLLDADMVFVPGTLREQKLTEIGYTILQCGGSLEYPNTRIVRMDYGWKCRGVTHEYWDGPTKFLPKDICYIDDRNDGGCKADKFERDARLLEKGVEDEPNNARYKFYLAQTYHSLGRWKDSIAMYKKRIAAGDWEEEIWYSHYMIAQCYMSLNDEVKFESWMLRAYKRRPSRAEPLYKLARYFREKSQHHKAYYYVKLGENIPRSTDSLFIEKDVYGGLFEYEKTILIYYIHSINRDGLRISLRYMLGPNRPHQHSVYQNTAFYIEPTGFAVEPFPVLGDVCGFDFHPSSVCSFTFNGKPHYNVRFVNYAIDQSNGSYMMKEGKYSADHWVRTQNVCLTPSGPRIMNDGTIGLPSNGSRIRGLEDVRVYPNSKGKLSFVATASEFSDKIRIVHGDYDVKGTYANCKVIESPTDQSCEKNWLPVPLTDDVIYRWHPLEVGTLEQNALKLHTTHETPWFFQHLRGSAVPIRVGEELWCLVHFVEYSTPRKYFHCFVSMDRATYKPIAVTLPFVFKSKTIEYCLGCTVADEKIECIFSVMDDNPCRTFIPVESLEWVQV